MAVDRQTVLAVAARAAIDLPEDQVDRVTADLDRVLRWAQDLPDLPPPPPDGRAPRRRPDQPVAADAQAILDQAPDRLGDEVRVPPVLDDA